MWGSSSPASKRNPSISSSTSVGDLPQTQGEGFRANLGDTWTAARSSSGTWEMPTPDMSSSPQRNDYSQLVRNSLCISNVEIMTRKSRCSVSQSLTLARSTFASRQSYCCSGRSACRTSHCWLDSRRRACFESNYNS